MRYTEINQLDEIIEQHLISILEFEHKLHLNEINGIKSQPRTKLTFDEQRDIEWKYFLIFRDCESLVTNYFDFHDNSKDINYKLVRHKLIKISEITNIKSDFINGICTIERDELSHDELEIRNIIEGFKALEKLIVDRLNFNNSIEIQNNDQLPSLTLEQENEKVMLLYELGVFDFLIEKYCDIKNSEELNPSRLSQIIESFTGIHRETIRQTYREITGIRRGYQNPFDDPIKREKVKRTISELKLRKKGNP